MKRVLFLFLTIFSYVLINAQGMESVLNNETDNFLEREHYEIGDIFDENGVKGLVVLVDDSGRHGLIMSLDSFSGKWTTEKNIIVGCNDESDGQNNMDILTQYIAENNMSWSQFPLFEWCKNKGKGWYIPSKDEVKDIIVSINGSIGTYNYGKWKTLDSKLKDKGGMGCLGKIKSGNSNSIRMPYHIMSSTEIDTKNIYYGLCQCYPFAGEKWKIQEYKKTFGRYLGSRAVRKF